MLFGKARSRPDIIDRHSQTIDCIVCMTSAIIEHIQEIDQELSKRAIALDPGGYFIIYVDRDRDLICAKHFSNTIDERGRAIDPDTGKPIPARGKVNRQPVRVFEAHTAKQLCVKIFEQFLEPPCPVTMLDHAAYLGRELQRAEFALTSNQDYVQD
jgi:dihydropteroate synthase